MLALEEKGGKALGYSLPLVSQGPPSVVGLSVVGVQAPFPQF